MRPTQTKPSIVFCHGIWADGSCFNKLIPTLQAEGHEVIAVQYGLDSQAADVAATKRTLARVSSPAILVGHSYENTFRRSERVAPRSLCGRDVPAA
jgi:pimeloyl-ACP methyl ester carboxylesterase